MSDQKLTNINSGITDIRFNSSVDYSRDGIYEMYGYKYKVAYGALWMRLYHHYSGTDEYFLSSSQCYSLNENTYSIISDFPYNNLSKRFYTYLLEYKQIPSFQIWRQDNYLNESKPINYQYIKGYKWPYFEGLSLSKKENCLDYTGIGQYWWFSIGTSSLSYYPHFPGPLNDLVQYADLWIMIQNIKYESCRVYRPVISLQIPIYAFILL